MTVLKPQPPTAAQVAAKAKLAEVKLETMCASHNELHQPLPKAPTTAGHEGAPSHDDDHDHGRRRAATDGPGRSTSTRSPINLADGHFLKVGLGAPAAGGVDARRRSKTTENWGALAAQTT